jgi:MFS family permease
MPSTPPVEQPPAASLVSAWAPLRRPVFAWLWVGGLAVNVGIWIRDIGAGWLMTELHPAPVVVSLITSATTLPMLLLSIPAGAMADVLDRRRLMLTVHAISAVIAALLATLVILRLATAEVLLTCTLALGAGQALVNPAWQAAMADMVPLDELPAASTLNSVSLNLSRAIGPGLGGLAVGYLAGPASAFVIGALSFTGIIIALMLWKPAVTPRATTGERFAAAMLAGLRYVRHSAPMHAVIIRTVCFVLPATSLWALMPLIAREHLDLGPVGYGTLLACMGVGAVLATIALPWVRTRLSSNQQVVAATVLYALALTLIASLPHAHVARPAMALAGVAWVTMVVNLNVAAQTGAPRWVRGRALAAYFTAFFGSMAIASPAWGTLAGLTSIATALIVSALACVLGLVTIGRWPLTASTAGALRTEGAQECSHG